MVRELGAGIEAAQFKENVQDIPKSVSVVSQDMLKDAGITRLTQLSTVLPSVTGSDQSQNSKAPGIRGVVSVANSVGVQSQTGIIVDDIPQPTFSTLAYELSDIERVEVFAGPQSTLSGRNAAGGIINIVTRTPSRTATADFVAEQSTDYQTRTTAFVSAPLTDTLAFSTSLLYNEWDGNLRNAGENDRRVGGFRDAGIRMKLRWEATDALTGMLTGYYQKSARTTAPLLAGGPYISADPNSSFIFAPRATGQIAT